jgi:hypothetical protein
MSVSNRDPFDAFDPIPRARRPKRRRQQSFGVIMALVVILFGLATAGIVALNGGFNRAAVDKLFSSKQTAQLSGELFVTNQGGDVKRAAGLTIHLTPVMPELRASFKANFSRLTETYDAVKPSTNTASDTDYQKQVIAATKTNRERSAPFTKALETAIAKGSKTFVADGDGKFNVEVSPGRYILWTDDLSILREHIKWCKSVTAGNAPEHLVLDGRSALFGEHIYKGMGLEQGGDVILKILDYDFLNKFADELNEPDAGK